MEILFMIIYIFGRILMGTYSVWSVSQCEHNFLLIKVASIGLLIQTVFFVQQMVGILRKRFKEISDRKRLRIKSRWFEPLNSTELEKLGINEKKEVQMCL